MFDHNIVTSVISCQVIKKLIDDIKLRYYNYCRKIGHFINKILRRVKIARFWVTNI